MVVASQAGLPSSLARSGPGRKFPKTGRLRYPPVSSSVGPRLHVFSNIELAVSTSAAAVIDRHARKRLKRHFDKIHWTLGPQILMFFGSMCPIFGLYHLDHLFDWVLVGTIVGVSGWVWRYWCSLYVATQKEFDHIAETDYTAAQSVALERFELTAARLDQCRALQVSQCHDETRHRAGIRGLARGQR